MPWKVEQRGSKWAVVAETTGEVVGTHESEEDAERQRRALYAQEGDRQDGVRRFDAVSPDLEKAEVLPNGFLRAPAYLTRTGVFEYRLDDGSVRRELRLPEDVFHQDALASFALAPITDDHPPGGFVTAENARELTVGHLGENVRQDGERVRALAMVTHADAVGKVKSGKVQLSCGYTCNLDFVSGEHRGERYDAVQRNIRGNHVAIVDLARAGPEARLKLDSGDGVSIRGPRPDETPDGSPKMTVKTRVDGIEIEVANEQAAQLVERALKAREDARDAAQKAEKTAQAELEKAKAHADEQKERADKAEKARQDAGDPAKLRVAVKARAKLERQALDVLGEEKADELDKLDDLGVKKAVLGKLRPKLALDGKTPEYIDARFDAALEEASSDALARAREAADGDPSGRADGDDERDPDERKDADELRADFIRRSEKAYQKPSVGMTR